jgi:hypothetical protein
VINPRLDILVWGAVLLLFLLLGARAWAVESANVRLHRRSVRVRALNAATVLALVALVGLTAVQGGIVFVEAVVTRTEPNTFVTVAGNDSIADPAVPDPDSRRDQPVAPADPNASPSGR